MTTEPRTDLPKGIEITALGERFRSDPYAVLAELRERDPVRYDDVLRTYLLTRHDGVDAAVRDRTLGVDPRKANPHTYMALFAPADGGQPSMLLLDAPDHTRLRALVNKAFTPRAVEALAPRIRQIAAELLDAIGDAESFDLIAAYAGPLPVIVIAEMLGVDPADRGQFKRWSDVIAQGFNPAPSDELRAELMQTHQELDAYLRAAIERRRAEPGDDLISAMLAAEERGDHLTSDEIVTMTSLLLAAGNITTTDLIGNGVYALLRHPEQLQRLRDDPSLIRNAVEEMLRYDSPVVETARIALDDGVVVAGCPVGRGESIMTSLAAANRDPAVYPDPDAFDIAREDTHHHSFGGGVHYCLGAPLARLEAQIAIPALLDRFPNLRLAGDSPEWRPTPAFRGHVGLRVLP